MTAASSVKPKAKFSSRNVNALYKAPAERGTLGGAVSAGYRTGGVNGLNRMLVLRGPVRGGALEMAEANAVAAPTPINTPSLRKEHMGQDIHVSLVPAAHGGGNGGGWGSAATSDSSVATNESSRDAQGAPAAPRPQYQAAVHAREGVKSAWHGDAPAVLGAHPKPQANTLKSILSSGSGRWGDDAVEEDLVQVEARRQMERRREFPDLREQQASNNQFHAHGRPYRHQESAHHGHYDAPLQSQDVRFQMRHASVHDERTSRAPSLSYGLDSRRGRDDHASNSVSYSSTMNVRDERGYHHPQHVSVQDVRYGDPRGFETHHMHDRTQDGNNQSHRRDDHRDDSTAHRMPMERSYGTHSGHRSPGQEDFQRGDVPNQENHIQREEMAPHTRTDLAWKTGPHSAQSSPVSSNGWKMGETEVRQRPASEVFMSATSTSSSSNRPLDRSSAADSSRNNATISAVRILKREGPRMLFDHKSGKMVEVPESQSSKRSSKPTQPQPKVLIEQDSKAQQSMTAIEVTEKETKVPVMKDTRDAEATEPFEKKAPETVALTKPAKELKDTHEILPSVFPMPPDVTRTQASKTKPRTKESKSKLVSMGGKMKRVVVAYRPVTNVENANEPLEKIVPDEKTEQSTVFEDKNKNRRSRKENPQEVALAPKEKKSRRSLKSEREKLPMSAKKPMMSDCDKVPIVPAKKPMKPKPSGTDSARSIEPKKHCATGNDSTWKARVGQESKREVDNKKTKRLTLVREYDASLPSKHQDVSEEASSDDGGFTTVKSRRTILLERKMQREQLAAALTGFHERCDVKRPSNRVTLPASIARFGKKGLVVAFKQKTETLSSGTSPSIPILEKSFIDVIRPPSAVREDTPPLQQSDKAVEDAAIDRAVQTEKKEPRRNRDRRVENGAENVMLLSKENRKQRTDGQWAAQQTSSARKEATLKKSREQDSSTTIEKGPKAEGQVTAASLATTAQEPAKRVRTTSAGKKEVKRVYVPKVTQTQAAPAVSETSSPVLPVGSHVKTESSTVSNETKVLSSHEETKMTTTCQNTKPKESNSSVRHKTVSSNRSNVPSGQSSADVSAPTHSDASRPKKKGKVSKNDSIASAPIDVTSVRKEWSTKPTKDVERSSSLPKPSSSSDITPKEGVSANERTKEKPKAPPPVLATDITPPPVKVSRRTSSSKGMSTKSFPSSASAQKIYKQVYVVKDTSTAATTSPSAA